MMCENRGDRGHHDGRQRGCDRHMDEEIPGHPLKREKKREKWNQQQATADSQQAGSKSDRGPQCQKCEDQADIHPGGLRELGPPILPDFWGREVALEGDGESTRLNSSHLGISYAVFCLKKKKT